MPRIITIISLFFCGLSWPLIAMDDEKQLLAKEEENSSKKKLKTPTILFIAADGEKFLCPKGILGRTENFTEALQSLIKTENKIHLPYYSDAVEIILNLIRLRQLAPSSTDYSHSLIGMNQETISQVIDFFNELAPGYKHTIGLLANNQAESKGAVVFISTNNEKFICGRNIFEKSYCKEAFKNLIKQKGKISGCYSAEAVRTILNIFYNHEDLLDEADLGFKSFGQVTNFINKNAPWYNDILKTISIDIGSLIRL